MIIGEEKTTGCSDSWLEIVNPATEEVQARVPNAGARDVDRAVRAARYAFEGVWGRMIPSARGKLLYRLIESIEKHTNDLALLDTQDMGKPYSHAREHDVPMAVEFLRFYAGFCDKIRGSQVPCAPDKHVYL
jgi:aldehyde dehydrogenase (NAD+)